MNPTILCVDDDAEVLKSLTILFEEDYNVLTCIHPLKALELLATNNDIRLILTDHRMPDMNGLQMLKRIRETMPERAFYTIIYSGYSEVEGEMDEMIRARVINEFLTKSCPPKLLLQAVASGIKKTETLAAPV